MTTAAQFSPCLPACAAVCGLSGRGGIPARQRGIRTICGNFGAANLQQDKGLASKPPLCPLTSARSADSFTVVGTGVLLAKKYGQWRLYCHKRRWVRTFWRHLTKKWRKL